VRVAYLGGDGACHLLHLIDEGGDKRTHRLGGRGAVDAEEAGACGEGRERVREVRG
jgi:hypothetical protein